MKKLVFTLSLMMSLAFVLNAQIPTKVWLFDTPEWSEKQLFNAPDVVDDLGILADTLTPVTIENTNKVFSNPEWTYNFTKALRLGGRAFTASPFLPVTGAVHFEMNGQGYIHIISLSSTAETRRLLITDGKQMLHRITVPGNDFVADNGSTLPVDNYYYNGGASSIFIYGEDGSIDLFCIEAETGLVDSVSPGQTVVFNVNVPAGTRECWIAGTFNGWNSSTHRMKMIDTVNYTLTIPDINVSTLEYKYLSGPDWDYVEKDALGNERTNRIYEENDTVLNWAAVYDTTILITKEITFETMVPLAVNKLYVVGQFNQWTMPDYKYEMNLVEVLPQGKLFRKTILVRNQGILDDFRYKFTAGADWNFVQTQEEDFHLSDVNIDTIRHAVFGFYNYEFSNAHPKDWNIGKMAGDTTWIQINEYVNPDGLLMMGTNDAPMTVDMDERYSDQLHFTHRLKTEGSAVFNPENSHLPVARALAFNIGENAQIAVSAASDSIEGMIFISDGSKVLNSIPVPGIKMIQNGQIPMSIFSYKGDSTTIYLYSVNGGVNFYYVGVSDYAGSPFEEPRQTYTVKVPMETQQVFISGDFNNWNPEGHWMDRVDSVTFQATIMGANAQMQYKYLNGPNWTFVEVNSDGTDIVNRNWSPVDTVFRWMNMFVPEMTKVYYDDMVTSYGEDFTLTIKTETNQSRTAISYQFELSYDPAILEFTGYSTTGTLSEPGDIVVNSTSSQDKIYISYMTTQPFIVTGDLVKLNFHVVSNSGYNHTQCWISQFFYDNNQIWDTRSGDISIESFMLGDVDGNNNVQAYDAALTLQYSVGMDPFPMMDPLPWENWRLNAANVDGVEGITANDASLILQYSAYMIDSFGIQPGDSTVISKVSAEKTASIVLVRENDNLIFKSYGKLVGLNLFIKEELDAFGAPVIASNINMSAVNIREGMYAVGLAATTAPDEGSTIMTIPLLREIPGEFLFDLIVNADRISLASEANTGFKSIEDAGISLYPNPVVDVLLLNNLTLGSRIEIYDISGRKVLNRQVGNIQEQLDLSALSNGVYTISILNQTTHVVSKFMKK